MLEQYYELLDALKEKKFSVDIRHLRQSILDKLNSNQFSPAVKEFLASIHQGCELHLMSALPKSTQPYKNSYIFIKKDGIQELYYVKQDGLYEKVKIIDFKLFEEQINAISKEAKLHLSEEQLREVLTSNGGHTPPDIPPFTDFEHEPDQVSQIKKIINALYHTERALIDAETLNLSDGKNKLKDLHTLYTHTFHHTYQACYLATHFDLDLSEIFSQELMVLLPVFSVLQNFAETYTEETKGFFSQIEYNKLPHKIGVVGGIIVDQLNPQGGDVDYEFITQFSAVLPGYLDTLSGYVAKFSATVASHEPNIDRRELEALQDDALQLLNALDRTRGSSLFLPLKTLHYIRIIRNTITLSMSIFEQAGHLSDSSQDAVRAKLSELKYKVLPALFGLSDKIEENAMLAPPAPGVPSLLSDPMMGAAKRLYKELIHYSSKFVDFSRKGRELVTIEDSQFVRARLDHSYQRMTEDHQALLKLEESRKAATEFFAILREPQYQGKRIIDLAPGVREQLIKHYKLIQQHVVQTNVMLNNAIIAGLTGTKGWGTTFSTPYHTLRRSRNTDAISNVISFQTILEAKLAKMTVSHQFHIKLAKHHISGVASEVKHLRLFPYQPKDDPYVINESDILRVEVVDKLHRLNQQPRPLTHEQSLEITAVETKIDALKVAAAASDKIASLNDLTTAELQSIHKVYLKSCDQLAKAQTAYNEFCAILSAQNHSILLKSFDNKTKKKLRNLYSVFQPHFLSGLLLKISKDAAEKLDKDIIIALSTQLAPVKRYQVRRISTANILIHNMRVQECFSQARQEKNNRRDALANQLKTAMRRENETRILEPELKQVERQGYVLKHDHYSKKIAEFNQSMQKLTSVFNTSVKDKLVRAKAGLPYPELEVVNEKLAQSSQALTLKRLFNGLYHFEQIAGYLEALNDQSTETRYAYYVVQISIHINKVRLIVEALAATPSFAVIKGEVWGKLQTTYNALMDIRKHYVPEPYEEDGETVDLTAGHSAVLYYSLTALKVLPEHINAMRGQEPMSKERIDFLHQHSEKVTADIERILASSDSYLKLFLEIPVMYRLFRELKANLINMASTSHRAVEENLAAINNVLLTKMLLEGDRFEDHFGLIAGTLTSPLKEILDTFYQGLLEPFGLKSQRHIALATSMHPFEQRINTAKERIAQASLEQERIKEKQERLSRLTARIHRYQHYLGGDPSLLATLRELLVGDFKSSLPILKELKPVLGTDLPTEANPAIDDLLNNTAPGEAPLVNIAALAEAGANYFLGVHVSEQLVLETAKKKIDYLTTLQVTQVELNAQFVEKYTAKHFEKQVAELSERPVGLIYRRREYNHRLAQHMMVAKPEIVLAAKSEENIDKKITKLLIEEAKKFERKHFKDYHHLEAIMSAIDRLKRYVHQSGVAIHNHSSTFETVVTLRKKSQLVESLEDLASNEELSVAERLIGLKRMIKAPMFKTKLLDYHHYDAFSFTWLKQTVATLLELIGLYTPERNKCYKQLVKAVESPVQGMGLFSSRFGIFSRNRMIPPRKNGHLAKQLF